MKAWNTGSDTSEGIGSSKLQGRLTEQQDRKLNKQELNNPQPATPFLSELPGETARRAVFTNRSGNQNSSSGKVPSSGDANLWQIDIKINHNTSPIPTGSKLRSIGLQGTHGTFSQSTLYSFVTKQNLNK